MMTDKEITDKEIQENLYKYFYVNGDPTIENGLVSCTGDVILKKTTIVNELPVQFKSVGGDFICFNNDLQSLTGAPQQVGGIFFCNGNQLTSLTGAPQIVGRSFACNNNRLESLTGAPRVVGKNFLANNNPLTSLKGATEYIRGEFYLSYSRNLPLLPLLMIRGVTKFDFKNESIQTNQDLAAILNRYKNTGTRGMLACAEEMLNAGYGSNANL